MPRLLKTEQPHHQKAFERYYALGAKRTYTQLASELGVDASTVKLWGRSFDWQKRIRARDLEEARQTADQTLNSHVDDRRRRRKLIDLALLKIAKAIAEDRVRYQASDLERIMRLIEQWDAASMWADGPPQNDPHEIVEYLRSIITCTLEEAYNIIRQDVLRDFPEYAEERLLEMDGSVFGESKCATLAVLCAARRERGP